MVSGLFPKPTHACLHKLTRFVFRFPSERRSPHHPRQRCTDIHSSRLSRHTWTVRVRTPKVFWYGTPTSTSLGVALAPITSTNYCTVVVPICQTAYGIHPPYLRRVFSLSSECDVSGVWGLRSEVRRICNSDFFCAVCWMQEVGIYVTESFRGRRLLHSNREKLDLLHRIIALQNFSLASRRQPQAKWII